MKTFSPYFSLVQNVASALDVVFFVREIIETNPKLRESILSRLLDTFYQIRATRVLTCALWIVAEYSQTLSEIEQSLGIIKQSLGDLPFYSINEEAEAESAPSGVAPGVAAVPAPIVQAKRPTVLADGTYATQSAASEVVVSAVSAVANSLSSNIRALLLTGDFFLGAVVAATLTKLVMRYEKIQSDVVAVNQVEK